MIRTPILVILLWCAGLLAGAQFAKIAVPIAEFRALYPQAGDGVAWLLTLISVLGAAFGVLVGIIAGGLGTRRVLLVSLVMGGVLSCWQSLTPNFTLLAISRVIEGISHLGLVVTAPTLIAQISSDRWRGASMALWSTFFGIAFALVAWFGLPFVANFGISALFLAHGVFMIVLALFLVFGLPKQTKIQQFSLPIRALCTDTIRAYRTPSILWPGLSWLFYTLTFLALLTILPEGLPLEDRNTASTVMSLVGIGISLCAVPVLLRFFDGTTLVIAGFALASLCILITPSLPILPRGVVLFVLLGFIQGGTFVAVSQVNHTLQDRALGFGIMAQTGNIGNLIGTPLLLALLSIAGTQGLFLVVALLYAIATCTLLALRRRTSPTTLAN